jgi:hypothetical protein
MQKTFLLFFAVYDSFAFLKPISWLYPLRQERVQGDPVSFFLIRADGAINTKFLQYSYSQSAYSF